MKDINVEEILSKHHFHFEPLKNAFATDGKNGSQYERMKAAIKEIIETVVDKCAQEAELLSNGEKCDKVYSIEKHDHFYHDVHITVDKQSILNVKKMINYELV